MNNAASTVILIDDDASVRRALGRLIQAAGYRVALYPSARAFLDDPQAAPAPACLVLDIQMPSPSPSGLDLQRALRARDANLPIIFITGHGDVPTSVRAMKDGAVDFLAKPVRETDLLAAIRQALTRAEHDHAQHQQVEAIRSRWLTLTPREQEVMAFVVRGRLNKQIADALGTVEKTIKVHRARIMEKMQVETLADLVRAAERLGVPPSPASPVASAASSRWTKVQ